MKFDKIILIETPSNVFGNYLRQQVEDRLKFYESGDAPRKNIDVMKEAIQVHGIQTAEKSKKRKKGKKTLDGQEDGLVLDESIQEQPKKKKKKQNGDTNDFSEESPKKKKASNGDTNPAIEEDTTAANGEIKKKKKKKSEAIEFEN